MVERVRRSGIITNQLLEFVQKRELMRKRKESGRLQPWSSDPILNEYRFCNVRRKDDRVSKWLLANVLTEANIKLDLNSFLLFSAWCRWINWPPTILAVMASGFYPAKKVDWERLGKYIDGLDGKVWTGAYMVRASTDPGVIKGVYISCQVIEDSLGGVVPKIVPLLESGFVTRRAIWSLIKEQMFWGSFMAGQVVDDWAWTSLLSDAPDNYTWAPQGPGSLRGLNRLLDVPLRTQHSEDVWLTHLRDVRSAIVSLGSEYEDVDMHSVQNCLCEYDKYERARLGEGRPRSKYRPETAY